MANYNVQLARTQGVGVRPGAMGRMPSHAAMNAPQMLPDQISLSPQMQHQFFGTPMQQQMPQMQQQPMPQPMPNTMQLSAPPQMPPQGLQGIPHVPMGNLSNVVGGGGSPMQQPQQQMPPNYFDQRMMDTARGYGWNNGMPRR